MGDLLVENKATRNVGDPSADTILPDVVAVTDDEPMIDFIDIDPEAGIALTTKLADRMTVRDFHREHHGKRQRILKPKIRMVVIHRRATPKRNGSLFVGKEIQCVSVPLDDSHTAPQGQPINQACDLASTAADTERGFLVMQFEPRTKTSPATWLSHRGIEGEHLVRSNQRLVDACSGDPDVGGFVGAGKRGSTETPNKRGRLTREQVRELGPVCSPSRRGVPLQPSLGNVSKSDDSAANGTRNPTTTPGFP